MILFWLYSYWWVEFAKIPGCKCSLEEGLKYILFYMNEFLVTVVTKLNEPLAEAA